MAAAEAAASALVAIENTFDCNRAVTFDICNPVVKILATFGALREQFQANSIRMSKVCQNIVIVAI